ncbi:MAG: DUF192 domain-containing protein [Hyphomonadaceae bacterium]|nr:DUF192 domain-containing protein [Hyphomonadaceae bacterium]
MDLDPRPNASRRTVLRATALLILAGSLARPVAAMRREALKLHTARGVHVIKTEITETQEEKSLGLMFRTSLADDAGMLFFYDTPQQVTMWMRNTYIPLDMVFIRADGIVHRIEAWTQPFSETIISSGANVVACLELAGGAAERLGLKPGDRVEHPLFKPKRK